MCTTKITKENFESEVINSEKPVLIDFWAVWCGPCQMLAPTMEEIAKEYADVVKVVKVNVDDEPELAADFKIASIPTLVVMKKGEVVARSVGYCPKSAILEMLEV